MFGSSKTLAPLWCKKSFFLVMKYFPCSHVLCTLNVQSQHSFRFQQNTMCPESNMVLGLTITMWRSNTSPKNDFRNTWSIVPHALKTCFFTWPKTHRSAWIHKKANGINIQKEKTNKLCKFLFFIFFILSARSIFPHQKASWNQQRVPLVNVDQIFLKIMMQRHLYKRYFPNPILQRANIVWFQISSPDDRTLLLSFPCTAISSSVCLGADSDIICLTKNSTAHTRWLFNTLAWTVKFSPDLIHITVNFNFLTGASVQMVLVKLCFIFHSKQDRGITIIWSFC